MPDLRVEYALICEEIRQEIGGKLTILGLFGPSPHVKITLPTSGRLDRLTVLFYCSPPTADGILQLTELTFGPVGSETLQRLKTPPPVPLNKGKMAQLIFALSGMPVPTEGRYALTVLGTEGPVATAEFEIRFAKKETSSAPAAPR